MVSVRCVTLPASMPTRNIATVLHTHRHTCNRKAPSVSVRHRLMLRLATFVVTVITLTLSVLLRWKRSGRGAHNSLPYSLSSPRTRRRQSLHGRRLDPETTGHVSGCIRCGTEMVVPMTACRLERQPWRLVWMMLLKAIGASYAWV